MDASTNSRVGLAVLISRLGIDGVKPRKEPHTLFINPEDFESISGDFMRHSLINGEKMYRVLDTRIRADASVARGEFRAEFKKEKKRE